MATGIYKRKSNVIYGMTGHKHSEETRRKMSENNARNKPWLGKKLSREHRENISKANMGHPTSEETKRKISKAHKGIKLSEEHRRKLSEAHKGQAPWTKGKHHSEETKKKISKTLKDRKCPWVSKLMKLKRGKNSYSWRGGLSFEPYGLAFNNELKEKIRKRDNYRCQECFRHQDELYTKTGRKYKLTIHHIDYDKENNQEENLISLCKNCHGQTGYSREDWTKYFQGMNC